MKHATQPSLDRLEPLLARLRRQAPLKEKKRGAFYLRAKAALHFHEDPAGLFADLRIVGGWQRFSVNSKAEQATLLRTVAQLLADQERSADIASRR